MYLQKHKNKYSLCDFICSQKFIDIETFLQIAISITQRIGELHKNNIIYKYINPQNIIVDVKTKQVKFVDTKDILINRAENLLYMSPEQTGRMGKKIDFRTDFYSLGVTFYEMLTGILPLEGKSELELTYSHIAKEPLYPDIINEKIPHTVAQIVMKLLEKDPQNRYKNCFGLRNDLLKCMDNLKKNGVIEDFKLGEKDIDDKFNFSEKLYGREKNLHEIMDIYKYSKKGNSGAVLVSGEAGIGKSALMKEVKRNIISDNGTFISCKCMQYDNSTPYSPIMQIATKLVRNILVKNEKDIQEIKYDIINIIGENGKIITDFIPELEYIIGKQETYSYGNLEIENSFNDILLRLVDIMLKKEQHIVFFMDDLQWIDSASLKLVKKFIKYAERKNILLIYTYRQSYDAYKNYAIANVSNGLEKNNYKIVYIKMKPLEIREVNDLICDTLNCDRYASMLLAKLITYKTGGNPFFVKIFLENMFNENILNFDYENGKWKWDINKILKIKVDENSLDLLIKKIENLPKNTIELLKMASCIGTEFDLKILSLCNDKAIYQNTIDILPAIRMGIVSPVSDDLNDSSQKDTIIYINKFINKYMFCHDHIHEQFYSMIQKEEKNVFHFKIGNVFLENFSITQNEINIFDIVNQLNKSKEIVKKEEKVYILVKLNLTAGKKAYASGAYELALKYLKFSYNLLKDESWNTNYELTYEVYLTFAQYQCLNRDFKKGEKLFNITLENSKTKKDKATIYIMKINLYSHSGKYKQAIENGILALKLYNTNIVLNAQPKHINLELMKIKLRTMGNEDRLLNKKKSITEDGEQINEIFKHMKIASMLYDKKLFYLLSLKEINLILKYGSSENDIRAYMDYAVFISLFFNDYEKGYDIGKKVLSRYEDKSKIDLYKAKSYFTTLVLPWVKGIDFSISKMKQIHNEFLNLGEMLYATHSLNALVGYLFLKGEPLNKIYGNCNKYMKLIQKTKFNDLNYGILVIIELIDNLIGKSNNMCELIDGNSMKYEHINGGNGSFGYYTYRLFINYLYGNLNVSKAFLKNAQKEEKFYKGSFIEGLSCIFTTLLMIDLYDNSSKTKKKIYLEKLNKNVSKIKRWAQIVPEDYESYYLLIQSKVYLLKGSFEKSEECFYKSIKSAVRSESILAIAIISEKFSEFYKATEEKKLFKMYLLQAYKAYKKWGVIDKLKQLKQKHPEVFVKYEEKNRQNLELNRETLEMVACTETELDNEKIDLISIVEASQAISREIVLENLLKKLMKILIENAGAQRGCLILKTDKDLIIAVDRDINNIRSMISKHVKVDMYNNIPKLVINYIARIRKGIVIKDASKENMFINDPYIYKNNIKSILCSPIMNKGKFIGIIYLENNFATDVFSQQRLNIVNLLSSQAAISIQNAYMYKTIKEFNEQLEKKVEERTKSLNETMRYEELRTEFFANISHELRTPLNVIFGGQQMLELLIKKNMPMQDGTKIQKYMGTTRQNCYRLVRLINNLIDITKMDAGYFQVDLSNNNIVEIVETITLSVAEYIQDKGINLIFDTDVEEKIIACDPDKIERIMLNLLSNAIKFTEKGGNILVSMHDAGDRIFIYVKDDGIGIPEEKQKIIFDRFIQVDKSLSRNREGSGIGLSIVKSLVELHSGSIELSSKVGRGTQFIMEFPNKKVNEREKDNINGNYLEPNKVERIQIEFSDIYSN